MADITIHIDKAEALDEVNKTSAYIGAKSQDEATYARVALTEANNEQLERFWLECCAIASGSLQQWLTEDRSTVSAYIVVLRPSAAWNSALLPGVKTALRGYLVNSVLAKWLMVVQDPSAEGYANLAAAQLAEVEQKMHRLTAPKRPS